MGKKNRGGGGGGQQQQQGSRPQQQQQQQQGPRPQQQQQQGPRPQQQQQQGPRPQQQQQQGPRPQQQQQQGLRPQQQQQQGPRPQQQQQQGSRPQQQQQQQWPRPQQQQQQGPRPQQQQQGPRPQQQQGPRPQQQQGPRPQQQQQWPRPQQPPQQQQQGPRPQQPPQQQQQGPRPQQPPQQQQPQPTRPVQTQQSTGSSKGGVEGISKGVSDVSLSSAMIPLRKGIGTEGRTISLFTNHLALKIKNPDLMIYHYDVAMEPEKPYRLYRKVVEEFRKRNFNDIFYGFDGRKNIFSCIPLGSETVDTVRVFDDEKSGDHPGIEYTVTVKYASEFSVRSIFDYFERGSSSNPPQLAIQALDIALRHPAAYSNYFISVGRSFFSPPRDQILDLGNGLTLWYGFYQSAILGWKQPFLNIDVAHKGFPTAVTCIEAICNINRMNLNDLGRPLGNHELRNFTNYIKGLKIVYEIPNQKNSKRTYKVVTLADPPNKKTFKDESGMMLTIEQYFHRKKNFKLRYPNMPCIQVGQIKQNKDICLPVELCRVMDGQVVNKKLDENQTANMVKAAARPAWERKERIMKSIKEVNYNQDPCIRQFGISVNENFEEIKARVMTAPSMMYHQQEVGVKEGVWRAGKFLAARPLLNWAIVNLDGRTRDDSIQAISREFSNVGRNLGIEVAQPDIKYVDTRGRVDQLLIDAFTKYKERNIELVVVIIPGFGDFYGKVKKIAELQVGILTQCLKARTVQRLNGSTVGNILLKVNAKLNGSNHKLGRTMVPVSLLTRPAMILGADVTHPSPDQETPSVAAVTASFDRNAFKYNLEWRIQNCREEIISDMENILKNHLMFFYQKTQMKPEKILFYRDGVSEGQFKQVLDVELKAMRRACRSLDPEYQPKITFLVVQKRHHTRFFPQKKDESGRNGNVPPGTIVDSIITHPKELDFYLVSHASIQGTSRPTKYHLLWDDADMSTDELESITYYLCHLFTRCTRAVSYPAPTYYAHLAAFRIRAYCDNLTLDNLTNPKLTEIQKKVKEANPMFYV